MIIYKDMVKNLNKYLKNIFNIYSSYLKRNYSESSEWKSAIGLEVHAQLSTASKLFSSGPSKYGLPTNSCVNLFDAAIPGTLPVLNKKAVELAVLTSLALKCDINPISLFDRKHYFYADLPNGYQITQQRMPLARNGSLDFTVFNCAVHRNPYTKLTRIKQVQLEQDSGKTYLAAETKESFIDLNRAGIALIEIVFEPDLEDAEEAAALVKELSFILEKVGSCSCKMEEGAMRVDANISVSKEGMGLGVRTEVKNIGSIRGVAQAINYEISRQLEVLKSGGIVLNQTLAWNPSEGKTVVLREKEEFHDYRFMPEPNLPPLRLIVNDGEEKLHEFVKNKNRILDLRHLKHKIPQLPQERRNLLTEKYNASQLIAYNIVNIPKLYDYFIEIITEDPARNVKAIYHILLVTLLSTLNKLNIKLSDCQISANHLGELVDLRGKITEHSSQMVLENILKEGKSSPKELVEEQNLSLLPEEEIKKVCLIVCDENPKVVQEYIKGKKKVLKFFVKRVIEKSNDRIISSEAQKIVTEVLEAKKNGPL